MLRKTHCSDRRHVRSAAAGRLCAQFIEVKNGRCGSFFALARARSGAAVSGVFGTASARIFFLSQAWKERGRKHAAMTSARSIAALNQEEFSHRALRRSRPGIGRIAHENVRKSARRRSPHVAARTSFTTRELKFKSFACEPRRFGAHVCGASRSTASILRHIPLSRIAATVRSALSFVCRRALPGYQADVPAARP